MKKFVILSLLLSALAVPVFAEYYKLENVRRLEKDLYRSGQLYIETRYCYHYTYGETAIYNDSTRVIIWADNSTCEVKSIVSAR